MSFKDAVCIVTGSAAGIGAACAERLAAKGARVVINYTKSEKEAKEVAAACKAHGGETILVPADVSSDADCRKLAKAALDKWGRIDALINNAGITKYAGPRDLDALSAEDFQRLYAVNTIGPYQMIRACVPAMQKQGAGAIVNVSSVAGVMGVGSSTAYIASKGALNAMTIALARALAPAIRVNAICPGMIETRWHKDRFDAEGYEKFKADYEKMVPLAKAATPDDIADAALWMIEGAATLTGELMQLDSGLHLGFGRR